MQMQLKWLSKLERSPAAAGRAEPEEVVTDR